MAAAWSGSLQPVASFYGAFKAERIGYALSGGGDVNGDGFDDFLIGTFHNTWMGVDAGAVYLFLGHSSLHFGLDDSVASADARFLGQQAYDAAGYSVANNGDLNGDGIDDIIVGAPAGNDKARWLSGRVYIVFGKKNPDWGFDYKLLESCDAVYEGENPQDLAGLSVAYIGDINADGFDDFLVGAPYRDGQYADMGKVYLILGRSGPWLKNDYLSDADAAFKYSREGAETGYSVAGIGDINDDGIPDFAIGAFGSSHVFVIYGRRSVDWGKNFDLDNADLILYGNFRYSIEGIGWKIAGGGDLNGDGIDDLIIPAILNSDGGFQTGKVYVLFGRSGGWETQEIALKNADASFIGEQQTDQAGWGVAIAGDVDDDGYDDFLVGTYKDDNGPIDGKAYLIRGKATGWQRDVPLGSIPDTCGRSPDGIGYTVATAGDFDGDAVADYIIAAPFNSDLQKWNGKVYLFASQQIPYQISGKVTYFQSGLAIPGTILRADTTGTVRDTTDNLGQYQLFVRGKHDHTVYIEKSKDQHVGTAISAYDAALIARMSIELEVPDSMNMAAADLNLDGGVNMYDAAIALHYAVELPSLPDSHAGEWEFVPHSMFYDSVVADQPQQDYIGFVRGDVDISWQYPDTGLWKMRDNPALVRAIRAGQEFRLPVTLPQATSLISFDLELQYDQQTLEFLRVETTDRTRDFRLAVNPNLRNRLLIAGFSPKPVPGKTPLIHLVFKPRQVSESPTTVAITRFQVDNFRMAGQTVVLNFEPSEQLPREFQLSQNYPNPFNQLTTIPIAVAEKGKIDVAIYNTLGKKIKTLRQGTVSSGKYDLRWDGRDHAGNEVTSGVYICRASCAGAVEKIKIIYIK